MNTGKGDLSPLFMACKKGYVEVAEELLKHKKCDVNQKDEHGVSPLHRAVKTFGSKCGYSSIDDQVKVVNLLLDHPQINVTQQAGDFSTPLFVACQEAQEVVNIFPSNHY